MTNIPLSSNQRCSGFCTFDVHCPVHGLDRIESNPQIAEARAALSMWANELWKPRYAAEQLAKIVSGLICAIEDRPSRSRMAVLARFIRGQIALADRPPPGCIQLNNEEAAVCAEALEKITAETPTPQSPIPLLGMSAPWPLHDALAKLIEATEHLLDHHACDTHGHEEFRTAANSGKEYLAILRAKASAVETKSPLDSEFERTVRRAGIREPLEVYTSNSYRRVGLKSEYKVVLSAIRHNDGQTDISNTPLLEALVAAFNAMLARSSSEKAPASPDELVGALQDKVHTDGPGRAAFAVKTTEEGQS